MPTLSELPPLKYPIDLPLWTFLFDSEYSVLHNRQPAKVRGFRDGETGEFISYLQLRDLSKAGCASLKRKYRLQSGQAVCIFGLNSIWYPVALFSILRAGGLVCGASPASTSGEMTHYLRLANAKIIFTSKNFLPTAIAAAKAVNLSRESIILLDGEVTGFRSIGDLVEDGKNPGTVVSSDEAYRFAPGKDATNVSAFLSFSSGTTGLPKAVQISHANMIAQCYQVKQISRPEQFNGVCLAVLPFFHIAGLSQLTFAPFFLNQEVVVLAKFEMRSMLEAVTKYKVNEMWLVPPIVIRLINDPVVSEYNLSNVKHLIFGAAPMSNEVIGAVKQKYPHFILRNTWGMTEVCGAAATCAPQYQGFEHAHTVGKALGSMSVKVVDPASGKEVNPGEAGEIMVKGPNVTMGYLDNERATCETFEPDGWLHTGDLGKIDEEGFIVIQDRIKELIKVKGIQVAPAELEDLLLGNPLVDDAAVISVPDPYAGELPRAFVVLKEKTTSNLAQARQTLLEFVKTKVSRHKWLDGGIEFVEEIPKSTSGKILRRMLKDRVLKEAKTASKL